VLGWVSALGSKHRLNVPLSADISYLCLSTSTVQSVANDDITPLVKDDSNFLFTTTNN
jgi:hypothetical protein